ncbi:pentapeptide repeat-containing protein [Salmonella enterica subsp. enterica serovar Mississippi]|uniref:pentapeptide repeat-containing protein n=1 Tax=Salmonella enterica TaxID=28901 RepID=UPI00092F70EC|nr:pentapeptide repeat-containing protein [Salmonella enterica]ECU7921894.1 pentapeptide repeat-containing protein [Salmonella enterica subsp. enterica serovar Mississippi]EAM7680907.1 pentapeptide repeat-containing protein [Salmonella enterica]EAS1604166.1 pentapeptide repeat-containing protein [Salmonella enterica]EAS6169128.1 pentapeptide repeat-containing protein [Salmonella enterica]EAT3533999.1 pentapeptide repeat-containing protein [Salmonella enterica]
MNSADLSKILEEHKVWITSIRESGSRANLCGANLCGADLCGANLCGANLCGADLRDADLRDADLRGANLRDADLRGANLRDADLCGANLCGANLRGADLRDADLRDADLRGANLCGANLPDLTFVILGEKYFISITNGEYVRAGCQNHTVEEWRKYSKQEIAEMDGRKALKFYPRLLSIIDFYLGAGEWPDWVKNDGEE